MRQEEPGLLQRLSNRVPDADELFAYDTVKLAKIANPRLGVLYCVVQLIIVAYVLIYVFFIQQGYQDSEKTTGWVLCKVSKPQLDNTGFSWDSYARVTNPGESGGVFIPTKILITRGQRQDGFCPSPNYKCQTGADCDIGNPAVQKKECIAAQCSRRQWCPAEDIARSTTEVRTLDLSNVELTFQANLRYQKFGVEVSTAESDVATYYPTKQANTYKLRDILKMTNYNAKDLVDNGAVMMLNTMFNCDLDQGSCDIVVQTANVDTVTGFNYVHTNFYYEDGIRKRDAFRMFGIRILTSATGVGKKTSLSQIVLQLSLLIALLVVAELVADFWMLNVCSEKQIYLTKKIEGVSQD